MSMTLSERAYYAIRDLIVRIELAPGDVIRGTSCRTASASVAHRSAKRSSVSPATSS